MANALRVGIIGANPNGGWARESHIPAIQMLPGLELAAIAGKTQSAADDAAGAFGVKKAYGAVAELVQDPDIDLITVAVTLPAHRELLLAALAAGKHVYCEYPLGLDVAESEMLAQAAQAAGVHVAIGLQARASPAVHQARGLLASGRIGRPLSARIVSTTVGFGPKIEPAAAYTEDPTNGVTVITIQAAHTIDLAIAVMGGLDGVTALASTLYPHVRIGDSPLQQRKTFDHLLVQARLSSGAVLAAEIAGGRPPETPFQFEIIGDAGVLVLSGGAPRGFQSGRLRLRLDGEPVCFSEGELASLPDSAVNVAATYATLRDDIAKATTNAVDCSHAVRLARLMEDAVISSETGSRTLPGDWPSS